MRRAPPYPTLVLVESTSPVPNAVSAVYNSELSAKSQALELLKERQEIFAEKGLVIPAQAPSAAAVPVKPPPAAKPAPPPVAKPAPPPAASSPFAHKCPEDLRPVGPCKPPPALPTPKAAGLPASAQSGPPPQAQAPASTWPADVPTPDVKAPPRHATPKKAPPPPASASAQSGGGAAPATPPKAAPPSTSVPRQTTSKSALRDPAAPSGSTDRRVATAVSQSKGITHADTARCQWAAEDRRDSSHLSDAAAASSSGTEDPEHHAPFTELNLTKDYASEPSVLATTDDQCTGACAACAYSGRTVGGHCAVKGSIYHRLCFCARHRCKGHCCHDCGKRCFYPNKHADFAKNTRACQCVDHCWVKDVPAEWPASGSASPAGAFRKTLSQLQRTGANPHWIKPDRYSHNLQERQRDAERDASRERRRAASAERRRRQRRS